MANVSDWSANELENVFLDDMNLSDERGRRTAKIMAAVKAKEDEQDARLNSVAGGLVFRGTKAAYADLEAVASPAVGDMYSVTELGGENYAWNGTAWDALGTSDANVVHKSGDEEISGTKTFNSYIKVSGSPAIMSGKTDGEVQVCGGRTANGLHGGKIMLHGEGHATFPGVFILNAGKSTGSKVLFGYPDGTLTWDGQEIQVSSDERIKTQLASVPDDVLDAWGEVQWGQFKFLDAVQAKGDKARLHLGLIAQRVKDVFEARGLDACQYGILCHDVRRDAVEEDLSVDIWMVRYAEAQAMEAAFQRRRADRLEERVAALEVTVHGNYK